MPQQAQIPVITGTSQVCYCADGGGAVGPSCVWRIDLETGDRRVLSGVYDSAGLGDDPGLCLDVIVDGSDLIVLGVATGTSTGLGMWMTRIDRATGNRTRMLEDVNIFPQTFTEDSTKYLVSGANWPLDGTYGIWTIDKATLAITGPIGTHPSTQALGSTYISGTNKFYCSGNFAPGFVWEINTGTGVFTDVSGGTGPELDQPYYMDNFGGLIYIANENDNNLVSLDPATGNKTLLPFSTGVVSVNRPVSIKVKDAETLYFNTAYPGGSFLHEHTYSGASAGFTKIISGAGQGTGVEFIRPFGMALSTVAAGQPF